MILPEHHSDTKVFIVTMEILPEPISKKLSSRVLKDLILHRSLINNSASLSNKSGGLYFIFKFGISSLLHHAVTTIADRIRVSESAQDRDVGLEGSGFRNFAKKESMRKAFQDMMHGLGEVNPTYAYYNGSCTSKDNKDPSWSTCFKTRRTQKTSSALEALGKTLFVLYLYLIRT
ncbi:hypothetical protein Tco_1001674, partial [Tanacetum coccineum]